MLYRLWNQSLTVNISDFGAQLKSIRGKDGTRYLYEGDGPYWKDSSPVLFPFVGRLNQGRYRIDGRECRMDIHGFAKDSVFSVVSCDDRSVSLSLMDSASTRGVFPRAFCFQITYTLDQNRLGIIYQVTNRDTKPLFFGLGGHPGFCIPLESGLAFEDYILEFDACAAPVRIGFSSDCFLNHQDQPFRLQGRKLPLTHNMFDDDAIVLKNAGHRVVLKSENGRHTVTVFYPDMDYLGLWHAPGTDASYICIEPWCSLPAEKAVVTEFEKHPSLLSLSPGETIEKRFSITFS